MPAALNQIQQAAADLQGKVDSLTAKVQGPLDALTAKLQAAVDRQLALRWTSPAMSKSLQAAVDAVVQLGLTVKLASPSGNAAPPGPGRKTDALSLGVGVSASAALSLSVGLSLGIGVSATASLFVQLIAGLHAAISQLGTLQRDLDTFNAQALLKAGTNGVMPPGQKLELGAVNNSLRGLHSKLSDCQAKANAAAAGAPVEPICASLQHPRMGAWECSLDLDVEVAPTGKVKFLLVDIEFTGTVLADHSGIDGSRGKCRIVAGNGHLSRQVSPHSYSGGTGIKVGTIVKDILRDCGEDLSDLSDGPTLDKMLPRWQVSAGTAEDALTALADQIDAAWRVLRDGTVWFGTETWPEVAPEGELLQENWSDGYVTLAAENPNMVPGTVYRGQRIEHVTHEYGRTLRTHIRTPGGSAVSAFRNLTKQKRHIDFSREYPCKVVKQNLDGTLQLLPDDAVMRSAGLDHVPIRYGIPGIKATVSPGARCHLAFAAGDQTRPFVGSWEYDPDKVVINSIFDGAQSLARVGDLVTTGGPGLVCTLTPVSLVGVPPNNAIVMGMPCMISFSALPFLTPAEQVPAFGAISSGIPKFQG